MNRVINRLVLKANRSLGGRLSDSGLVQIDQLDDAMETFVARLREGDLRESSLLRVLLFDLQVLPESDLLAYQLDHFKIGGLHLDQYQVSDEILATTSMQECAATWTLPIDNWNGTTFLATAYYMSDFVRQYWEDRIDGPVSWLVCPYGQLDAFFELREQALVTADNESPEG